MTEAGCQAYMDADGMIGIMHNSSMGHAYVAMRAIDPEVAALQSTIARLEARITQLESEKELMLRGAEVYKERISELESGRGEPVAWMYINRDGYAYRCTKLVADSFPVYRSPPAPVVVASFDEIEALRSIASAPQYYEPGHGITEVDIWEWFRWNGHSRPINKHHLCDVLLDDGRLLFDQSPYDFDWSCDGNVVAARHRGQRDE